VDSEHKQIRKWLDEIQNGPLIAHYLVDYHRRLSLGKLNSLTLETSKKIRIDTFDAPLGT
jgi:hypothetical protein